MVAALVTGVIMRYAPSSWITWATGATLVHDALFFGIVACRARAHRLRALAARTSSSRCSTVASPLVGGAHAAAWLAEVEGSEPAPAAVIARDTAAHGANTSRSKAKPAR